MGILLAIGALAFLIIFHEFGHFCMARLCKVEVEVFSLGFGPKLFIKQHKNTKYCLCLILLGGYVALKQEGDGGYLAKPPIQKRLILLGGPLFNLLLAGLIYLALFLTPSPHLAPIVGSVLPNMPAKQAGLQPKDQILSINHKSIRDWQDLQSAIQQKGSLSLEIKRQNQILHLQALPKEQKSFNAFKEPILIKMLGITPSKQIVMISYPFLEALNRAYKQVQEMIVLTLKGIKKLLIGALPLSEVNSVVGIVDFLSTQSQLQTWSLSVAFISINLGLLNLFPIPLLDGGQLFLLWLETLIQRKISPQTMQLLNALGFAFLLSLMGLGLFNDLTRPKF
ncbi:RIP metalloprotease RseP [Helicobacter suis]|uniref:RIP metalloprotease RseP n=1 Tax=Helicobacter suis TaxID=104628 RepID=UPI00248FAE65|nr:RIP metalloprotease RseP [Helicobacter suis]